MYPTITDLLKDLFGINLPMPIQSFGFFVAISFLLANYFFGKELFRKEKEGLMFTNIKKILVGEKASILELGTSFLIGFLLAYKIVGMILNYDEFTHNPQHYLLSYEGSLIGGLLGGALSAYLKFKEKDKEKLTTPVWKDLVMHPHEHVGNMTMIAAISGIIGAKIFHNLENWDEFMADPIEGLVSFSGLTMYGGLILGSISVIYYANKNKLYVPHVIDSCAPSIMLAYGTGRIGCQLSGDGDWGIDNLAPKPNWMSFLPDWMWSFRYPHNVISEGVPIPGCEGAHCNMLANPVWPTPFYESIMCIVLFFVLWSMRKKIKTPGVLFSIYLIFNGIERFFIEKIRVNTEYHILGGITQAEIISTILFLLGIAGVFYFKKLEQKKQTVAH